MAHQRKLIRAAVESKLKNANTMAGQKVFSNRVRQIFASEVPCILIYTKNEPAEIYVDAPREYLRNLSLVIELVATALNEDTLDDTLDDFCDQVERAMVIDETVGGLATDCVLVDTEIEILTEGEKPIGAAKLTFTVPYTQQMPDGPAQPLADLKKIDVKIDPAPADQVNHNDSEDLITVPT